MSQTKTLSRWVNRFNELTDFSIIFLSVFIVGVMSLYYNVFWMEIQSYIGWSHRSSSIVAGISSTTVSSAKGWSQEELATDTQALAQIQAWYQEITSEHFRDYLTYRARSYDLAFNTLPPGKRLIIDSIGVDTPIVDVPYASNDKLENGDFKEELKEWVVKYPFTSKPGEKGNTLLFGHSSVDAREGKTNPYGQVFAKLPKLAAWDLIKVIRDGQLYIYEAVDKEIKRPKEVGQALSDAAQGDEHLLTLMACYPLLSDAQRMLVKARLRKPKQLSLWTTDIERGSN